MEHFYSKIDGWFTFPNLYKEMVKRHSSGAHFVEIGSWHGRSSSYMAVEILNSQKDIKFDCVDTWEGSLEHSLRDEIITGTLYDLFLKNIESVSHIINPIRMRSLEAVNLYSDNSLDFVFIDASHDYKNVMDDIRAWYPKVKAGGVLAGHDYTDGWVDLVRAVDDFLFENKLVLDINSEDCWGIIKGS